MRKMVYLTVFLCYVFAIVGCIIKDNNSSFFRNNPLSSYTDTIIKPSSDDINSYISILPKTSITFQIIIPSDGNGTSIEANDISKNIVSIEQSNIPKNIKADSLSNPAITFKLKLFATVEYDEPPTFLAQSSLYRNQVLNYHKRVRVDDASIASATFDGIPVLTAIGEVIIEGGNIQGYTEFQGAIDLASTTNNVIRVYPKSKKYPTVPKQLNEVIAETLQEIASDPYLLQDALPKIVTKISSGITNTNINLQSNTVYNDVIQIYKNLPRPIPSFLNSEHNISINHDANVVTAGIYVDLPKDSKILRSKLYCYSQFINYPVRDNKTSIIKAGFGNQNSPTVIFIKKAEFYNFDAGGEGVVLAKLITKEDLSVHKNIYVSATSTAEVLVLYDQRILSLPVASFTEIRQSLQTKADFIELVNLIQKQLLDQNNPYENIIDENSEIWRKASQIASELSLPQITEKVQNVENESLTSSSIRGQLTNASYPDLVGVEDDRARKERSVVFYNKSYCYYEVFEGGATEPRLILERNDVLNELFAWPPTSGRKEKIEDIGPGVFTFEFRKNVGLTLFDAFLTAFSTFVGYKIDKLEDLREVYKTSATVFMDFVNTLALDQPRSWRDTYDSVKKFILDKNTFITLLEILSKVGEHYAKEKLKDGWLKTAASFIAQKVFFWGNLAQGISDITAVVYSSARSPKSFLEYGEQTKEGWYGDTFREFVKNCNKIHSKLILHGQLLAKLENGNSTTISKFFDIAIDSKHNSQDAIVVFKPNLSSENEYFFVIKGKVIGEDRMDIGNIKINVASQGINYVSLDINSGEDGSIFVSTIATTTIVFKYNRESSKEDEIGKVFRFKLTCPVEDVISEISVINVRFPNNYYFEAPFTLDSGEVVKSYTLMQLLVGRIGEFDYYRTWEITLYKE